MTTKLNYKFAKLIHNYDNIIDYYYEIDGLPGIYNMWQVEDYAKYKKTGRFEDVEDLLGFKRKGISQDHLNPVVDDALLDALRSHELFEGLVK